MVTQHMALLVPHLGGKAYALRSAIVTVCTCLILHLSGEPSPADHSSMPTLPSHPQAGWQAACWAHSRQRGQPIPHQHMRKCNYDAAQHIHKSCQVFQLLPAWPSSRQNPPGFWANSIYRGVGGWLFHLDSCQVADLRPQCDSL